jgi:carbohydrate-selective porin OprB
VRAARHRRRVAATFAAAILWTAVPCAAERLVEEDSFDLLEDYAHPEERQAHLDVQPLHSLLGPYDRLREYLRQHYGLEYFISFAPMGQLGTQSDKSTSYNQKLEVIGHWHVVDSERWWGRGNLDFRLESLVTLGNTTRDFSDAVGSSYNLNDGDTSPDKNLHSIATFAWDHFLFGDRLRFVAGKLDPHDYVALNRFVGDDREDFFSTPFSAQPVPPLFEANALGAFASYNTGAGYVAGMIIDAEGDKRGFDFSHLDRYNYHYAAEIGVTPQLPRLGQGAYRVTYYASDDNTDATSSGHAFSLSLDQNLGERYGAFLRFAHSWRQHTNVETLLSAGFLWLQPFGYRHDGIGVGLAWSDPSNEDPDNERDQYALEVFWRFQLTKRIELTPDVQFIVNPSRGGSDFRFVGGLRFRVIL